MTARVTTAESTAPNTTSPNAAEVNSPRMIKRVQRSFAVIFAALALHLALSEQ